MRHQLRSYGLALAILGMPVLGMAQGNAQPPQSPIGSSQYVDANGYPIYPPVNYGDGKNKALIDRGEYLAKAGDCAACHSDPKHGGAPFAGGRGIKTPFGTFYTPNITADKETGIGNWTDADFLRAMQQGLNPQGENYFPVFPYPDFNRVSKQDLLAIKAYLFSIPAVYRPNTPNEVIWPFGWRFFQWGWKILFFEFYRGEYQYNPAQSPEWNRGAYLVKGLGHCAMCHSPLNLLGAVERKYELTGGFVDGYYAPDITANGLGNSSIQDVMDVFQKDEMLRGAGKVQGPMYEVNYLSLHYLTPQDLRAIAVYLKSVPNKPPMRASAGKIGPNTGREIYEDHCAVCHDSGAAGAPKRGDIEAWQPRIAQGLAVLLTHAMNGYNSMPPKGTCMTCSDGQIKAAVEYLVNQSKPGAAAGNKPKLTVSSQAPLTMQQGQQIYQAHCSVCHDQGKYGALKIGDKTAWAPILQHGLGGAFNNAIHGHQKIPGGNNCASCTNGEVIAATKYMAQKSAPANSNYALW